MVKKSKQNSRPAKDNKHNNNNHNAHPVKNGDKHDHREKNDFDLCLELLVKKGKQEGFLTYDEINNALSNKDVSPQELDKIFSVCEQHDIEIVDESGDEGGEGRSKIKKSKKASAQADVLDDPVRMYLKQMGSVPLLTREQEVEICKRIEETENNLKENIFLFGQVPKEALNLAKKIISGKERFDRIIQDSKFVNREKFIEKLKDYLEALVKHDTELNNFFEEMLKSENTKAKQEKLGKEFNGVNHKMSELLKKFYFKQKAIEDFADVVDDTKFKMIEIVNDIEKAKNSKSQAIKNELKNHKRKLRRFEISVRMESDD